MLQLTRLYIQKMKEEEKLRKTWMMSVTSWKKNKTKSFLK
jgi:hypothetical protein